MFDEVSLNRIWCLLHPGSTTPSVTNLSGCFYLGLGISAILNLVNPNIRQILKLTISLVLYGLLSGCIIQEAVEIAMIPPPDAGPYSHRTGKNYYEPEILMSNKDIIRIKYFSAGANAEHEQVKQLMSEHCHGAYIETSRVELRGYDTVEAECTHGTESLQ